MDSYLSLCILGFFFWIGRNHICTTAQCCATKTLKTLQIKVLRSKMTRMIFLLIFLLPRCLHSCKRQFESVARRSLGVIISVSEVRWQEVFKVNGSTSIPAAFLLFPTGVERFCLPTSSRLINKKKPYRNSKSCADAAAANQQGALGELTAWCSVMLAGVSQSCVKPQWQMKLTLFINNQQRVRC